MEIQTFFCDNFTMLGVLWLHKLMMLVNVHMQFLEKNVLQRTPGEPNDDIS